MNTLSQFCVGIQTPIADTIACIDKNAHQIALVTDGDGKLLGTVTDGDIRRAILRGLPLSTPVKDVMNANPRFAMAGAAHIELLRLLRLMKVSQLPLLDDGGHVVDLFVATPPTTKIQRPNHVILMAGGLGKRLRPLTETVPKPMLKISGKPILQLIVESFIRQGFSNFTISVNYLEHQIRDHFGDGSKWDVSIGYLVDNQENLGTAGSLRLLADRPEESFIVMNGDILTSVDFHKILDFHEKHSSLATMAVFEHRIEVPFGVIDVTENRVVAIREKPTQRFFVNAGIYVLNSDVIDFIPPGQPYDMPTLFERLMSEGRQPAAFPMWESWLDIGRPQDLEWAQNNYTAAV